MNKVEEKHSRIVDDVHNNDMGKEDSKIRHASITQDVVVKFSEWKDTNYTLISKEKGYLSNNSRSKPTDNPFMTTEQLYTEFITNHYKP